MITQVGLVAVYVGDIQRARDFCVGKLGLVVRQDATYESGPTIQVSPDESNATALALIKPENEDDERIGYPTNGALYSPKRST
jgi:catechol 2,3-dioxygenase-like lactoylglutathione lyase family enzyme